MYISWVTGNTTVPAPVNLMVATLSWLNAQYYGKQSSQNFAIAHLLGHVEERISSVTGQAVPKFNWGHEAKKPQNLMS
jgi:hypothetical protein